MEIWFPAIVERVLHRDGAARGVGEVACDGLKPNDIPAEVIETRITVTWPDGRTLNFVELVPKRA